MKEKTETMSETHYLALLRGINVGGNNIIKMTDLKTCFENMGFTGVVTYIQSGNVVFKSTEKNQTRLLKKIETGLSQTFNYKARIAVITYKQLKQVISEVPPGFGKDTEKYRYDVLFLMYPLTSDVALKSVKTKEGVDNAYVGKHALYFSRLISKASQSRLSKISSLPMYQNITIRNWNTTTKLLALMTNGLMTK